MALWHLLGVAGEAAPIHRKHVPSCITSKPCIALAGPLQCAVGTSVSASAGDHMDMYGDCTTSGTEDGRNVVVTAKEECGKTSMQATKISREIHRQGRAGLLVCARVDIGVDGGGMQSGEICAKLGGRHLGQGVLGRRGSSPGSSFAPKFTSVLGGRSTWKKPGLRRPSRPSGPRRHRFGFADSTRPL